MRVCRIARLRCAEKRADVLCMRDDVLITIRPYWHKLTKESIDRPLSICPCGVRANRFHLLHWPPAGNSFTLYIYVHDNWEIRSKTEVFFELLRCRMFYCSRIVAFCRAENKYLPINISKNDDERNMLGEIFAVAIEYSKSSVKRRVASVVQWKMTDRELMQYQTPWIS